MGDEAVPRDLHMPVGLAGGAELLGQAAVRAVPEDGATFLVALVVVLGHARSLVVPALESIRIGQGCDQILYELHFAIGHGCPPEQGRPAWSRRSALRAGESWRANRGCRRRSAR